MNQYAVDMVKSHEGCRLTAYQDQGGVWTIGWGATGPDIKQGFVWTQQQADDRLVFDLAHVEQSVRSVLHVAVGLQSIGALIDFAYNLGAGALQGSTALKLINSGDHIGGAKALISWDHIGQTEIKGLLIRRFDEASLYLKGV